MIGERQGARGAPSESPDLRIVDSVTLPYVLSLPSAAASRHPVLCFLHGYDEAAPHEIRGAVTRHGPLRPGNQSGIADRFIIVAPQLARAGDVWNRHAGEVRQIVEEVQKVHGGDPQRTYLSGFSFGGNGVFDLALTQRDLWAALWPVDPTRVPPQAPERPVWLSIGEVARHRASGFIQALGLRPAADPVQGDRLYLDEGQDHVGSATLAYRDERVYAWLLSKRLSETG